MSDKKNLYFGMDGVLVDFESGPRRLGLPKDDGSPGDEVEVIFDLMDPMPEARDAVAMLAPLYDLFILSTSPCSNPTAFSGKLARIQRYFGDGPQNPFYIKVVFSPRKDLAVGDHQVDDRPTMRGVNRIPGEVVHHGGVEDLDWCAVVESSQLTMRPLIRLRVAGRISREGRA